MGSGSRRARTSRRTRARKKTRPRGVGLGERLRREAPLLLGALVVLALALVLMGYGGYALSQARTDVFPEFAPPQVQIQTEAPGLAPAAAHALPRRAAT